MADIHLLFDVFGGESIHEGSGREINRQLTEIVRQINANPFKINFEADEEALNRIKKAFSDLHKSIGENGTIKFDTPNLSDISKTLSAISENFRHVLTGIGSQNLQLKQIFEAIPDGGDSSVKSLARVIERIEELTRVIDGLGAAVDEINTKTDAVNLNVIGNGAIQESQEQLHAYREYLNVVMREFAKVQAAYNGLMDQSRSGIDVRKAYDTSAVVDSNKQLSALMRSFDLESAINNSSVMDLDQLKSAIQTYTSMLGIMSGIQSKGQRIFGDIDNAGITAARQEAERAAESINKMDDAPSEDTGGGSLSEYVAKIRSDIETLRDPCKEIKGEIDRIFTFDGIDVTGSEELVGKVKSVCEQLGEEFDNLRAKVANTFNFSGVEIIPPDVTKTVSELANVGKDIPVGGVTGLTRNEIEGIIKSKLGSEGGALAESSLKSFGVSAEDAKRIAEDLLEMGGNIKDVTTQFKDLADGTRNSFNITATATDELGNTIKEKLTYRLQEVENEAGETLKALQLVQREQIEKISYGSDASNPYGLSAEDLAVWDDWNKQHEKRLAEIDQENIAIEKQKQQLRSLEEERDRLGKQSFDTWDATEEAREVAEVDAAWSEHIKTTEAYAEQIDKENIAVEKHRKELQALEDEYDRLGKRSFDAWDAGEDAKEEAELEQAIRSVNSVIEDQANLEREMSRIHDEAASRARQRAEAEEENRRRQEAANEREQESARKLESAYNDLYNTMTNALDNKDRSVGVLSDDDASKINSVRNRLQQLHDEWSRGDLTQIQYKAGLDNLKKSYKEVTDSIRSTNAEEKARGAEENKRISLQRKLSDETSKAAKFLRDYTAAEHSSNQSSRDAYKAIQQLIVNMDELNDRIKRNDISTEEATREQRTYSAEFARNTSIVEKNGDAHLTAFGKIAKAVKTHLTTLSATAIIGTVMREARELITTVTEIDTAMTELRKVTDETEERYARFLDNAATRAKNLSATISDTVTATADFARLGLTIDEAEAAADAAIVYKAVGDGIENISDASQSIVSTMKAFGIEASDAMTIVDKFNEVGNNYAISSAGVGEALLRSAAAMQAANNTLDETIGLATAANTILQNPQSVGTMLKTVSMYVRAAKTELEAAGEETDGIAESTGKLRELVKQITKEGGKAVDIMADENTFKSTYQIMKEISEVWDNISDANQAALLEKLGGKRNANAIAAMLENFEIAEQAMQSAAEASGSAMNELEKFQQSIQGHVVAFKTAYQELAQTLIDGELVKWAIDFGTWMVNLITRVIEFTDKLGGLSSVLAVVANILIIKDKEAILGFLADAYGGLKKVVSVIGNLGTIIPQLISGLNMGSVAFVGITAAITAGIVAFNAYKKRMQELRQDIAQTATEASRHGDDLISLYRQYDELSEKVKTDESAKDDLLTVTDRLIESLGIEETQVNNLAQKYRNLSDAIKQATADSLRDDRRDLQLEYNEREKELLGAAEDAYLVDVLGTLSNSDKAAIKAFESSGLITGTNGKLNPFEEGFSFDFDPRTTDGAIKAYETYKSMIDILDSLDIKEGALYNAVTKQYTNLKSKVESYNEITQQLNDNLVNTAYIESVIGKANVETKEDFDKLRDSIVDTINATGNYAGNIESVEKAVDDFLKEDSLYAKFYGDFSRTSVEEIESLKREQEEYNAKLRDQINVINELVRVKNDAAQAGFNPGETVFGNIDTNNRQVLEWTESNVDRFRSALESWGYALEDIEEMKGDISTVLGGSDWFGDDDGVEIAYSPILQTEDGPVLLSRRTVMEYIWALFDNAGGKWDASKILELDTQGLEFDGLQIKNLIASIGDDAVRVGEVMHFAGKDGAYAQAMSDAEAAASDLGVSVSDLEVNLVDLHKELADGKRKLEEYNAQAEKLSSNPAAPISNPFTSINTFTEKIGVLRAAMDEFNSGGLVTNETLLKLNSTFGDENKLVEILNGKLVINTDEVDKLVTSLRDQYGMEAAVAGATADQIAQMDALASSMMSVKEATEDPIASMNELSKVLKDMQSGIEMSTSDTLSLVNKYPQLRDKIIKTANGYKIEESAIRDLIRAKSDLLTLNAREIGLESSRSSLVSSNKSGLNQANAIDRIFANFESENGRNIKSMKEFLNAYQKEFGHAFAADTDSESGGGLGGFVGDYKAYTDYIKKKIEFYKNSLEDAAVVDMFTEDYLSESGVLEGYDPSKDKSSSSSTTTTKEETQFEKDYKAHQHALAMDRETTAQYLAWLEGAYKASYAKNEMELDDYYKYEEEVYEGRKQLFQTSLDEMQHQIDLLEHSTGDTYDKQAGIYMQMQKAVHDQAEMYRARGVKENSEMIRELQDQWWTYEEAIRQLREQSFNDWLNDQKFTIDLQKKNNESTDAILQSWKTVLGSLNDELKYYLSVGYDSTSDVVQNIMGEIDSAKEEMIAALEEVVSKANDVVDGFQNAYTTLTSAASEYASTGYLSVDSLQSILELGPKYLDMLYDEGGQLVINEDRLQRVIEARTNELAAETALSYAKQILLATENGEVDKLRDLADVQATSSNATWDMAYATLGYAKALGATKGIEESYYDDAINHLAKMQSLTHTATSSIAAYYKTLDQGYVSQADGLETILKLTEDMIKQENDDKIDALEKEKDIYKDIIDEKKELLRIAKEQADHDRDQADKLKEIAELQSRIDQLALDDSREAAAQRSQLEAELLEKQKALADEQGDYAYDAQVDALDKQYDAFEKEKEDETKALKEELNSAEKLYQAAIARINNGWDTLYQDLLDWNYNYGSTLQKDLTAAWDAAYAAAERYGSFVEAMEGVKEHTQLGMNSVTPGSDYVQSSVSRGAATVTNYANRMRENSLAWFTAENPAAYAQENQRLAREYQQQTGTALTYNNGSWYQSGSTTPLYTLSRDEVGHAVVEAMKANSAAWNNSDYTTQAHLAQMNEDLAKRLSSFLGVQITKTPGGVWMLGSTPLYEVRKFHSGGIAGSHGTMKQNEVMAILKKGESVLDSKREEALYKTIDFVQILSDKIGHAIDRGGISSLLSGGAMSLMTPASRAIAGGIGTMNFAPTVNVMISGGKMSDENARRYGNIAADAVLDQLKTAFTKRGISTAGNGILK